MGEEYSLKRLDAIEAKVQRHAYIKENFPMLENLSAKDLWFTCIYQGQMAVRTRSKAEAEKILTYFENVMETHPFQMEGMQHERKALAQHGKEQFGSCMLCPAMR